MFGLSALEALWFFLNVLVHVTCDMRARDPSMFFFAHMHAWSLLSQALHIMSLIMTYELLCGSIATAVLTCSNSNSAIVFQVAHLYACLSLVWVLARARTRACARCVSSIARHTVMCYILWYALDIRRCKTQSINCASIVHECHECPDADQKTYLGAFVRTVAHPWVMNVMNVMHVMAHSLAEPQVMKFVSSTVQAFRQPKWLCAICCLKRILKQWQRQLQR